MGEARGVRPPAVAGGTEGRGVGLEPLRPVIGRGGACGGAERAAERALAAHAWRDAGRWPSDGTAPGHLPLLSTKNRRPGETGWGSANA